jgi:hypothetical protein
MKRTKIDKSKLRLNAETLRMLTPENLEQIQGGKCTAGMTSTFGDGNCTNACHSNPPYCTADTQILGACALSAYC